MFQHVASSVGITVEVNSSPSPLTPTQVATAAAMTMVGTKSVSLIFVVPLLLDSLLGHGKPSRSAQAMNSRDDQRFMRLRIRRNGVGLFRRVDDYIRLWVFDGSDPRRSGQTPRLSAPSPRPTEAATPVGLPQGRVGCRQHCLPPPEPRLRVPTSAARSRAGFDSRGPYAGPDAGNYRSCPLLNPGGLWVSVRD